MTTNFFSPLSFVAVFFLIRDPGWVKIRIRDPGSGINIPDPPHWTIVDKAHYVCECNFFPEVKLG
jgi:hypothetical protein